MGIGLSAPKFGGDWIWRDLFGGDWTFGPEIWWGNPHQTPPIGGDYITLDGRVLDCTDPEKN